MLIKDMSLAGIEHSIIGKLFNISKQRAHQICGNNRILKKELTISADMKKDIFSYNFRYADFERKYRMSASKTRFIFSYLGIDYEKVKETYRRLK